MNKQDVTIYDVAREAKVSMATVSRVVNGNNNVRKETRDRVMEVIKRLHYQPNAVAQGLASKRTTTVGLIVPDLTNLYFAELSKGIDDIAVLYKYNIIISSVENRLMKEGAVIQGLLNKQVDGVIYMSNKLSEEARKPSSEPTRQSFWQGLFPTTWNSFSQHRLQEGRHGSFEPAFERRQEEAGLDRGRQGSSDQPEPPDSGL